MVNNKQKLRRGRPHKKLEDKLSKVLTTEKQKIFLRNRLAGLNKRQAAIQAGYAPNKLDIRQYSREFRVILTKKDIEAYEKYERITKEAENKFKESIDPDNDRDQE